MATLAVDLAERRRERRHAGGGRWQSPTLIRPGQRVTLINICSRAALLESDARLRPGAQTELQLARTADRLSVRGRLERCYVSHIEPIRYRGVLVFEQRVEVGEDATEGGL